MIETEQAAIAKAADSLDDLQAIGLVLCHKRWTVDLAERYQADIQDIDMALSIIRRWMSTVHKMI
jgi:hypothetical protein